MLVASACFPAWESLVVRSANFLSFSPVSSPATILDLPSDVQNVFFIYPHIDLGVTMDANNVLVDD
jgi:hypothetical protein